MYGYAVSLRGNNDLGYYIGDWLISLGAVIIIIYVLSVRVPFLLTRPFLVLGKISYSFYLFHLLVLLSIEILLGAFIPILGIFLISLLMTIVISLLSYRYIEKPSMKLARSIILLKKQTEYNVINDNPSKS
nr:acyltransferase [Paenisporosarcina indica]